MFLTIARIDKVLFEGEFKSVYVPGITGDMQILPKHEPLITALKKGVIIVEDIDGKEEKFEIERAFLEVNKKEVNIIL